MFRRGPQQFTWNRFTFTLQIILVKVGYMASLPKAITSELEGKPHSGKLRKFDGTVKKITHARACAHTHTHEVWKVLLTNSYTPDMISYNYHNPGRDYGQDQRGWKEWDSKQTKLQSLWSFSYRKLSIVL